MTVKEIFEKAENGTLTYDEFVKLGGNAKFADLNEGQYVSKRKYEDELNGKSGEIDTLNETISQRDADLKKLKKQLKDAGTDADKLSSLSTELTSLQEKYKEDTETYKKQLESQAYEFAVREFATTQKFSSKAARRDFIESMIKENLNMKDGEILGAKDFVKSYSKDNEDAFVADEPPKQNAPAPQFVTPTQPTNPQNDNNSGFAGAFHFSGVRQIPGEEGKAPTGLGSGNYFTANE